MRTLDTPSCDDFTIRAGDRVIHINHGHGTALFVYKDGGCEVQFDENTGWGTDTLIVSMENLKKEEKQ